MVDSQRHRAPRAALLPAVHVVALTSGFAGLGYEMVWTRSLTVALGHEVLSVLSVLAAFFTGMALGARLLHRPLGRAHRPALWYAALEALIGVWALLLILLLPTVGTWGVALLGPDPTPGQHWSLAFGLPLVLLLPATSAMGATLPALERWLSHLRADGWVVASAYGANTLGAALGVLLTTFALAPVLGYAGTTLLMAALNFICAATALALWRHGASDADETGRVPVLLADTLECRAALGALFITGLLGIGFEVLARICHRDPEFWGKLAKQIGRSHAES